MDGLILHFSVAFCEQGSHDFLYQYLFALDMWTSLHASVATQLTFFFFFFLFLFRGINMDG